MSLDESMALVMISSAVENNDMEYMIQLDYRIEELLVPLSKEFPDYKIEYRKFCIISFIVEMSNFLFIGTNWLLTIIRITY